MSDMVRVLHVFGVLDRGGAESMIMNIYRHIDRSIIQFDFVIHADRKCDYSDEILSMGGRIYSVPRHNKNLFFDYKKWWYNFISEYHLEYRVIHIHMRSTASIYIPIAKRFGIKTIIHSHSTSNGMGIKAIIKKLLQIPLRYQADYLFACSKESAEWLFGKNSINHKNCYIVKNSVDLNMFEFSETKRKKVRNEIGIDNKDFILCHIGNFTKAKNHEFLLRVFYELRKVKQGKLLLVGADNDNLQEDIRRLVHSIGLVNDVYFLGKRKDIPDILCAADCFIFPSVWEGFPVAVLEAQASGLPCFISNTITKEIIITNQVLCLPIDQGSKIWANKIANTNLKRTKTHELIKSSGYDVTTNALWLSSFYLSC